MFLRRLQSNDDEGIDGSEVSLFWMLPFLSLLLCIAFIPLFFPRFWHKWFWTIPAVHLTVFLISFFSAFGFEKALIEVLHTFLEEYIPFIGLMFSLFVVSGGIRVKNIELTGQPWQNTCILLLGVVLASWMSTTGASLLLVRPLIRANHWRKHKTHIFVFFIFMVANIGGSLSPLGDPPLFLGFLKGIDFFWFTKNLFPPMFFATGLLLTCFVTLECYYYYWKEDLASPDMKAPLLAPEFEEIHLDEEEVIESKKHRFDYIDGLWNVPLLIAIPLTILLTGYPSLENGYISFYKLELAVNDWIRNGVFFLIGGISLLVTKKKTRVRNGFNWFPILEVSSLFMAIFLTIIPAILILQAEKDGELAWVIETVTHKGEPHPALYFWFTGFFSSFLDNAPTFLIFFNTAGGNPEILMNDFRVTLLAISTGAVFMGANTYIGNAPNFMVRSICENSGINMPSFFGYMIWSVIFLFPMYGLVTAAFFMGQHY